MAQFDAAKAIFSQVDVNHDGSIDPHEFRQWVSGGNAAGGLSSSLYQSSAEGQGGSSGFFISGGAGSAELDASISAGLNAQGGIAGYGTSHSSQNGFASISEQQNASSLNEYGHASSATFASSSAQQGPVYPSAGGLYDDPNPKIIVREAAGGPVTYQQKILVRFLQPPAVPPPGPLIIKEIRPPQPPPPPPLVVRQRAPAIPPPPPLILRERPPLPPAAIAGQTVVRRLPPIPVPPRSVIIERLPPLPPKPRDIIIERWIPYGAQAKRRTIVQRAPLPKAYASPRNIIIVYEAVQVRVQRQFQRLGVTQENPQAYLSRYGASLLDGTALLQQARAAGVVEDLSAPAVAQFSSSSFSAEASSLSDQNSSFTLGSGAIDLEGSQLIGGGGGGSYSSQLYASSSGFGTGGATIGSSGIDFAGSSFAAADTNHDGSLDEAEFRRFIQGGL